MKDLMNLWIILSFIINYLMLYKICLITEFELILSQIQNTHIANSAISNEKGRWFSRTNKLCNS